MTYQAYLRGPHWQSIKLTKLKQADHRCQLCGSESNLEVHHNTYVRLGAEELSDLVVLCHSCHGKHHNALRTMDTEDSLEVFSSQFWPPVRMSDKSIRKGPLAEIVGRV